MLNRLWRVFIREGVEFIEALIIILYETLKFSGVYLATWVLSQLSHLFFEKTAEASYIDWAHKIALVIILLYFLLSLGKKLWGLLTKEKNHDESSPASKSPQ